MNHSYKRAKKASSATTMFFLVISSFYSFIPVAAVHADDSLPVVDQVSAPADTPSTDAVDASVEAPAQTDPTPLPEPTVSLEPSTAPESTDVQAVDTTPVPEPTAKPETSTEDATWQILPNGKALTTSAVNMSTTYVAPQNPKVTVHFTQLPDTPGNLTIQEIKLTAEQQQQLGALSDTAYDISSNMENGTFKYDLTLPNPAGDKNATVKYAEDVANLDDAQDVTQKQSSDEDNTTVSGLNHFTVFVLVNDANTANASAKDDVANADVVGIDDSYIGSGAPNTNHNSDALSVRSDSANNQRSLVKFSSIGASAGSTIDHATLRLFMGSAPTASAGSRTYQLYRATQDWDESTVTWNNQPTISGVSSASATTGTTDGVWLEWDVTADAQSMLNSPAVNFGWMVKDSSESSVAASKPDSQFFRSENGDQLRRPQLVVDFAAAASQPTDYKNPTASIAAVGGDDNGFEVGASNAFVDGGLYASNTNGAGDAHIFSDYHLSIPAGSTINGIEVRADWFMNDIGATTSLNTQLWNANTSTWTSAKSDITQTDHEHIVSFGDSADKWGKTWNVSDFSDSNFKVKVTMNSTNNATDFYLDWIPVRVYYTPAASDTTAPAVPTLVSPASGSIIKSSAATLDWSDSSDPSSPVTYRYQSSFSSAVGANNGFTSPIFTSGTLATSQIDATGSAEGVYYWQARACDSLNNCSNWSGPWQVTIDNTKPVIAFHSTVVAEATSASGATVTYTAPATSDNVDAAGMASCLPASGTLFSMGNTVVTCNATDTAGNAATPTNFTVTVHDTTAPVITLVGNNPETVELGGSYSDAGATASDNIDGNITGNIVTTGTVNTSAVGSYTKYYNVSDAAGNPATQVTRTVNVVDTTKPAVPSLVSPANGSVIKPAAATLDWTDETDLSNPVTYQYQSALSSAVGVNNGFTSPIYTSGSLATSQIDATGSADNTYYWQVRACDALNNCSDWSGPWQVTIDGTAPVTTDAGTDTNWHNSDVTVTLSCTDNLSGCDVIYWNTDGTDPTVASHEGAGSSVVVSTTGVHTIKYFSIDQAGNQEAVKTAANTVKIDKVLPSVPVIGSVISPTNNPIVSWTWSAATDVNSGIQHYAYVLKDSASNIIDSGTTTLLTYSHTVVDGIYTFFMRAVDNANNESADAVSDPLTVDLTAPTTPAADNVGGPYYSYPTVTLTSSDVLYNGVTSDPVKIYYTEDGSTPDSSSTLYTGSLLINHSLTLKAIAYDNAGNASSVMTEVYVIAPIISNVVSNSNSNPSSERVIEWDTDIASSSRVVYGTTSVPSVVVPGGSPDYGYASSTSTTDTVTGVTHHTVTVTGLNSYTTYYFRVVSSEALENVSDTEYSFGTEATQGNPGPNGDSNGSSSSNGPSSPTGTVLGATTKAPTKNGSGSSGSGSGSGTVTGPNVFGATKHVAAVLGNYGATITPSISPSPETSPTPTPSEMSSPTPTPTPASGTHSTWPWWYWVLIVIILGMGYYLYRTRTRNNGGN